MEESAPDLRLLEPASPEKLLPDAAFPWWALAILVLLLAAVALFLLFRKKSVAPADPATAREEAFARSLAALRAITAGTAREAAVQASLIVRRFLAEASADPALFETHEEFVTRRDSLRRLTDSAREAGSKGFSRLAGLKYSPAAPDLEPHLVIDEAGSLLETLHRGFSP